MLTHSEVLDDQSELRAQLQRTGGAHRELLRLNWARPLGDIAFDWVSVLAATAAVAWIGPATLPIALIVVANRQRALGNILHDAGHRNLCRTRQVNDSLAGLLVAPLLFASLERYRADHFRHHLQLGTAGGDPDLMVPPDLLPRHWLRSYLLQVCSLQAWWGDFCGHLGAAGVPMSGRAYIVAWWLAALALMLEVAGAQFTSTFVGLWLLARATVFHLITTLREMCDHFGLRPGGILSFTRDTACHGLALGDPPAQQRLPPDPSPAACRAVLPAAAGACAVSQLADYRTHGHDLHAYFAGPERGGAATGSGRRGHDDAGTRAALQVAALLVSASYGIGFLFGSGEMALMHGMAGGIYGVATALGMLACWRVRQAGCGSSACRSGSCSDVPSVQRLQRAVALLSLVWMSGVLGGPDRGRRGHRGLIGLQGVGQADWCWC
jgi:fatty acid desaturase